MLQIGFCLYRADENAKRLVNIDSHFEQLLIAIMYKCVCISIPDWTYINRHYDPNFTLIQFLTNTHLAFCKELPTKTCGTVLVWIKMLYLCGNVWLTQNAALIGEKIKEYASFKGPNHFMYTYDCGTSGPYINYREVFARYEIAILRYINL